LNSFKFEVKTPDHEIKDDLKRFNCTKENKDQHFIQIEEYMNKTIPILEYMNEHKDSLDQNQQKQMLLMIEHFKSYRTTEQNLQKQCLIMPLEECCKQIVFLEDKFHQELNNYNHHQ
jgi:hypothetical protein